MIRDIEGVSNNYSKFSIKLCFLISQSWYRQCYDTALNCLETEITMGSRIREDRVHGGLLVMAELLRCANADWERINRELEDTIPLGTNLRRTSGNFDSTFENAEQVSPERVRPRLNTKTISDVSDIL